MIGRLRAAWQMRQRFAKVSRFPPESLLVGIAAMLLVGMCVWAIRERSHELERADLLLTARQFSGHLREFVATRVKAADLIRAHLIFEDAVRAPTILRESAALQRTFPGYLAINWIDASKRIVIVGPPERNAAALGQDLGKHPLVNHLLDRAQQSGDTLMSAPIELYQTGSGFTTYTPVDLKGRPAGWLNTVYRLSELKTKLPPSMSADDLRIYVLDSVTGVPVFTLGPSAYGSAQTSVRTGIEMYGQTWQIRVVRSRGRFQGRWWLSALSIAVLMVTCGLGAAVVTDRFAGKRRELRLSLERSNRDNLLLKTLVHDLSDHMQVVLSSLELLQGLPQASGAQIKSLVEQAWVATYREQDILDQVRRMKGAESGRLKFDLIPVSLGKALGQASLALRQRMEAKNVRLDPANVPASSPVFAEPYSLQHNVLGNVLSNAIKFSAPGGLIVCAVEHSGGEVCLSIEDHGEGISRVRLAALFTEGGPSTRPGTLGEEGTGFGLLLVRAYMDLYGGRITISTRELAGHPDDHGTTVRLYFRAADD